jgi:hypothetical protein
MAETSKKPTKRTSAKGRQDGDYAPPVLAEPVGGPIPPYTPPGGAGGTGKTA